MKTLSLLGTAAVLVFSLPAYSEEYAGGWSDTADEAVPHASGQQGDAKHDSGPTNTVNYYVPVAAPGQLPPAPARRSYITGSQSLPNLPKVSTGTVVPGTHNAPGSLALMTETGHGGELPRTVLNEITKEGFYDDSIWGNEGENGPPPRSDWNTIGSRALKHATTGHHSDDLPSIK